jgi:hypothetical protein
MSSYIYILGAVLASFLLFQNLEMSSSAVSAFRAHNLSGGRSAVVIGGTGATGRQVLKQLLGNLPSFLPSLVAFLPSLVTFLPTAR